jgi:hypothetical protein
LSKEDYQKALAAIQELLSECVGDLVILSGYLQSDLMLDPGNTPYALMAAKDIIGTSCEAVKNALSYTYPML